MLSFLLTFHTMADPSPLLRLPAELRNNIYSLVASPDQNLTINRDARNLPLEHRLICKPARGLVRTCRQLSQEFNSHLLTLALQPSNKTIAPVYGFDYRDLASIVQTLSPEEIAAANQNHNFVAQLFILNITKTEIENLRAWLDVCDRTGIEVGYTLNWTAFSLADFRCLEGVLQGHREGPRVWRGLGGPSASCLTFSWFQRRRSVADGCF